MLEDKKLKNKLRKRKSRAKIKNDAKLHKEYKLAECAYSKKYYKKKTLINSKCFFPGKKKKNTKGLLITRRIEIKF